MIAALSCFAEQVDEPDIVDYLSREYQNINSAGTAIQGRGP